MITQKIVNRVRISSRSNTFPNSNGPSELGSLGCDVEEESVVWEAVGEGHESGEPTGTEQLASCVVCGEERETLLAKLGIGD